MFAQAIEMSEGKFLSAWFSAVVMPLSREGVSRLKNFWYGQLSGSCGTWLECWYLSHSYLNAFGFAMEAQ